MRHLDKAAELDQHLKPNIKDEDSDNDDDDEDLREEKNTPNAGTEKRTGHYPNMVHTYREWNTIIGVFF